MGGHLHYWRVYYDTCTCTCTFTALVFESTFAPKNAIAPAPEPALSVAPEPVTEPAPVPAPYPQSIDKLCRYAYGSNMEDYEWPQVSLCSFISVFYPFIFSHLSSPTLLFRHQQQNGWLAVLWKSPGPASSFLHSLSSFNPLP